LEDARIDQRKKALARTSERIAQARAKANATSTPLPVKEPATPKETTVSALEAAKHEVSSTLSPSTPLSGARSPLHPSLPAKPGASATPSKPISSHETPTKAVPTPASAPTPTAAPAAAAVAAAPSPAPAAPPTDDQIARLEEVGTSSNSFYFPK
jgi:THO complex subunit 1